MAEVAIGLLAIVFAAVSQTPSTEILGPVSDSSGAVIAGARVTLLRVATGERRETVTDSTGNYSFPLIDIGEYDITIKAAGFTQQERKGIALQLQQKARINFELTVGETRESVEVVSAAIQLKTDDSSVGQVIDNKRIVELPLNGRNISGLAVLTAGVSFGSQRSGENGSGGQVPGRMVA